MYLKRITLLAATILVLVTASACAGWLIPESRNPHINANINPAVNTSLNPNINTTLNPKLNSDLNPAVNKTLNPQYNASLNPDLNTAINPKLNTNLNPKINSRLNPKLNSAVNPKFSPDNVLFRFDKNLQSTMYIVTANPDFILFYDSHDELALFGVKNSSGGYAVFNPANHWVEYMVKDSVGFLIFSVNGDWIGIVR